MYSRFARNSLPVFVTLFAATLVTVMGAQAPAAKTTKDRVYSATQAAKGEQTYMSSCVSCHPPATYKGAVFLNWQGRSLGDLLAFLSEKMPKNDPGGLSPKEYTQVMAFLLKINGMPAGQAELPVNPAALSKITINILPDKLQPSHHP
ncbi:MAG TPA: cytochrome c [Vicinamibacterales bacterium]|nr:cytochrome c [Vicinamibacterales bacterium]